MTSVAAQRKKKENENKGKREAGEEEKIGQPISERLRTTLLLSFKG